MNRPYPMLSAHPRPLIAILATALIALFGIACSRSEPASLREPAEPSGHDAAGAEPEEPAAASVADDAVSASEPAFDRTDAEKPDALAAAEPALEPSSAEGEPGAMALRVEPLPREAPADMPLEVPPAPLPALGGGGSPGDMGGGGGAGPVGGGIAADSIDMGRRETGGDSTAGRATHLKVEGLPRTGRAARELLAAGVLTAGSFDDRLNYESFRTFVQRFSRSPIPESAYPAPGEAGLFPGPGFEAGRMVALRVVDAAGVGLLDAEVSLSLPGEEAPLVTTRTRAGGKVVLIPGLDGDAGAERFDLRVVPFGAAEPLVQQIEPSELEQEIVVKGAVGERPKQLDLAFVVDATGSMSDELEYLKLELDGIVSELSAAFPDVAQRYALVVYRDEGDMYLLRDFDFSADIAAFSHTLAAQRADGGGDTPEAMHAALGAAVDLDWRMEDTARIIFLIADAPPHQGQLGPTTEAMKALRDAGVAVYPVAASGVDELAELVMRTAALMTAAQYLFLTDDSGLGNPHAEPHIPCYDVEHLNDAVVRMIAIELSGNRIPAKAEQVLRSVGHQVDGVCVDPPPATEPGATEEPQQ